MTCFFMASSFRSVESQLLPGELSLGRHLNSKEYDTCHVLRALQVRFSRHGDSLINESVEEVRFHASRNDCSHFPRRALNPTEQTHKRQGLSPWTLALSLLAVDRSGSKVLHLSVPTSAFKGVFNAKLFHKADGLLMIVKRHVGS
jgi:hypothetical protein